MKKLALVFPGQGSQTVGMMQPYAQTPIVREVFTEASDVLGQDFAPEDITRVTAQIASRGIQYKVKVNRVQVAADRKFEVLALLSYEQLLPRDTEAVIGGNNPGGGGSNVKFGLRVSPLDGAARAKYDIPRDVRSGVVVTGVSRGSTAETLGLQPGDVVLQVNRTAVRSARELDEAYRRGGNKIALLVYRDGATSYVVFEK